MTNSNLTDERLIALIRVARDSLELYEMELPVIDDVMQALAELQLRRAAMLAAAPQQEAENRIQIGKSEAKEEWDMGARLTKHRFKP
ncbi:hypothetical protein [Enterobacter roggenkampii]|uniref:Uncharacterized protein n=1 Tax=Enterobacter roggenkampii TaxID=1812935 RepID=A0AAU9BHM6_9ENTR|nr:hypothetical protein [Enterobacter roggenkampii]BCL41753.1 hypothetical protein OIPHN260_12550 [Enterobacter roggenkampii]